MEQVSVKVTNKQGLLFASCWLVNGTICDMPKDLATNHATGKNVQILGAATGDPEHQIGPRAAVVQKLDADADADGIPDELAGVPHAAALVKAGVNSIAELQAAIDTHGDGFAKALKLTKSRAADIAAHLATLAQ